MKLRRHLKTNWKTYLSNNKKTNKKQHKQKK